MMIDGTGDTLARIGRYELEDMLRSAEDRMDRVRKRLRLLRSIAGREDWGSLVDEALHILGD